MPAPVPSLVAVATLAFLAACKEPPPLYPEGSPPEIVEACALTQRKCTACHDRDRILYARMSTVEWRDTVDRMRRFAGSSISPAEAEVILRCLLHRQATTTALEVVEPAPCAQVAQP